MDRFVGADTPVPRVGTPPTADGLLLTGACDALCLLLTTSCDATLILRGSS